MIEPHYSVNVATNYGAHYCRIKFPATLTKQEAIERARLIKRKFGDEFEVDLIHVDCVGHPVDVQ